MKITVFTPIYNRAYAISDLYNSLINQTFKDFEWIIVDDGSSDNTNELIKEFENQKKIKITYFWQTNKGKHFAINKGVSLAKGELFFILDSDDFLPNNSLQLVDQYYNLCKNNQKLGGLAGRKAYFNGDFVGSAVNINEIYTNSIDFRHQLKIKGDIAEVFLTSVLKEFPFPEIENEKFCPEVLIWNRIATKYDLYFFNQSIYNCEYLPDGLTAKIVKIRMTSPIATMLTYAELEKYNIPVIQKIKANINFWRFSFNSNLSFAKKVKMIYFRYSLIGFLTGFLLYLKDILKQK